MQRQKLPPSASELSLVRCMCSNGKRTKSEVITKHAKQKANFACFSVITLSLYKDSYFYNENVFLTMITYFAKYEIVTLLHKIKLLLCLI